MTKGLKLGSTPYRISYNTPQYRGTVLPTGISDMSAAQLSELEHYEGRRTMMDGDDTPFRITKGAIYIYTSLSPKECRGHRYKVIGFIKHVPSYQDQVLVKAMTGPDKGTLFCCTPWNFTTRYIPDTPTVVEEVQEPPTKLPDKIAGQCEPNPPGSMN